MAIRFGKYAKWLNIPLSLTLLVLSVSLIATYLAFSSVQSDTARSIQTYFDYRVRAAINRIESRVKINEEVLRGLKGLFKASKSVERKEFRKYVSSLRLADQFPGIQGVGFSLIIPSVELDNHITAIRREGFPTYSIYPEGQREIYTSIIYLEPFSERNLRAFGYDMYSESVRSAAMQRALVSGNLTLSGKVRLVQESGQNEQAGFLMYLPVYHNDKPHTILSERRENIIGWVYSVFRMDDFMKGLHEERSNDLGIEIYDGDGISNETLMHNSDSLQLLSNFTNYKIHRLQVADHYWTVRIHPLLLFKSRVDVDKPLLVAVIGAIASLSLTLIVWLLLTGRERAINAAKSMNTELIYEQKRLSNIIEGTHVGTWEWNVQTGETTFNEFWAQMIGYVLSELQPTSIVTWTKYGHPDDLKRSRELLEKHFSGELPYYECETRLLHKNGHWIWALDRGKVATWTLDCKPLMMFGTHQDITRQKLYEAQMLYDSQYDALTSLPNRILLADRLQQALFIAKRDKTKLGLMFIDLDKFKTINDTLGHGMGDLLLETVGQRIQSCIRESDTVARIGGDEFVVLLPKIEAEQDASGVAEKIYHVLNMSFELAGQKLSISSSIGIAIYPEHGDKENVLMENADIAMYYAKTSDSDKVRIYKSNMQNKIGSSSR